MTTPRMKRGRQSPIDGKDIRHRREAAAAVCDLHPLSSTSPRGSRAVAAFLAAGVTVYGDATLPPPFVLRLLHSALRDESLLVVSDYTNHRLLIIRPSDGSVVRTIGNGQGNGPDQLDWPGQVAVL